MIGIVKFSEFVDAGDLKNSNRTVGLENGLNSIFNNPWTFLAPGSTADRPAPDPSIAYRLRFNTDLISYEFYDTALADWQQLEDSGDVSTLIAQLAAHTLGNGASMIGLLDQGGVSNKTVQDLANTSFIGKVNDGVLNNSQYLSDLDTGILKNTTGTGDLSISTPLTSIDGLTTGSNQTIYTTAANTYAVTALTAFGRLIQALNAMNNAVLVTNGSGAPSMSTTLPSTVQNNITQLGTQAEPLDMGSLNINNLANPVLAQDGATKSYVDMVAIGLNIQGSCVCASTADLNAVYANGAAGIGATLTNAGVMVAFSADGVSPSINDRVLIKNQSLTFQNGIYILTTIGDGVTNWVLTRATDFDTPGEIQSGDLVPVVQGTTQSGSSWMQTQTVAAVGVDSIVFIQFSASIPANVPSGGTGNTSTTANGIITGGTTSTGNFQNIGTGTLDGQLVKSNGAGVLPGYTTATYPSTTTLNRILYSSAANVVSEIVTAISAVLSTDGSGVPSFSTTLPTGLNLQTPSALDLANANNLEINLGTSGILDVSKGGSNSDLSSTGGENHVVKQETPGAPFTVGPLSAFNLSDGTTGIGLIVMSISPSLITPSLGTPTSGNLASCTNFPATSLSGTVPTTKGGTGTATTFTLGSVVFAGASGIYTQDNANFFWDDTNNRLGIGTAGPNGVIHISSAVNANAGGSTNQTLILTHNTSTDTAGPGVAFNTSSNIGILGAKITFYRTGTQSNGHLLFWTKSDGAGVSDSTTEKMRIMDNGNVLIGTTTSTTGLLQVNGTFRSTGILGVTDASAATAGTVGEIISATLVVGSAVSLTSGVAANVTSISLTAGDWDVYGQVGFNPAGTTTATQYVAAINTASATLPLASTINASIRQLSATFGTGGVQIQDAGTCRINVSGTTTVYLIARSTFAISTNSAYGAIWARRAR